VLECVVNVAEGRRDEVIDVIAGACRAALLDVHRDRDHHRSVFTLAGTGGAVEAAVHALAAEAVARIDLREHTGVHPRLGVVDVVPFVALAGTQVTAAVAAAQRTAQWFAAEHDIPVFLYGAADAQGRALPDARRDAFTVRAPDLGPTAPHPTAGAVCVGVRPVLVALNCVLATADVATARAIAREVRERDGGRPGVRALGFDLASRTKAQVSMNLVDLERTGLEAAVAAVDAAAATRQTEVLEVELVGLVPMAELERCSRPFRDRIGLDEADTIEGRVASRGRGEADAPDRSRPEPRPGK